MGSRAGLQAREPGGGRELRTSPRHQKNDNLHRSAYVARKWRPAQRCIVCVRRGQAPSPPASRRLSVRNLELSRNPTEESAKKKTEEFGSAHRPACGVGGELDVGELMARASAKSIRHGFFGKRYCREDFGPIMSIFDALQYPLMGPVRRAGPAPANPPGPRRLLRPPAPGQPAPGAARTALLRSWSYRVEGQHAVARHREDRAAAVTPYLGENKTIKDVEGARTQLRNALYHDRGLQDPCWSTFPPQRIAAGQSSRLVVH